MGGGGGHIIFGVDEGRTGFYAVPTPARLLSSPAIRGLVLYELRKEKRFSPSRLNFSVISGGSEVSMEARWGVRERQRLSSSFPIPGKLPVFLCRDCLCL